MKCNSAKTELVIFNRWGEVEIKIDKHNVTSKLGMKILGLNFRYDLCWDAHVSAVINKVNSLSYALRYVNSKMSRQGFKRLIHAHVISRLSYGSQVWSGCTSYGLSRRVTSCYFKFMKLYCKDFRNKLSRRDLLERSELRSLDSIFKIQACKLIHSVCFYLVPEQLALSVLSKGYYSVRFPNRVTFYRRNSRKVGVNSFTNRLHLLENHLNFNWLNMSQKTFCEKINTIIPNF